MCVYVLIINYVHVCVCIYIYNSIYWNVCVYKENIYIKIFIKIYVIIYFVIPITTKKKHFFLISLKNGSWLGLSLSQIISS